MRLLALVLASCLASSSVACGSGSSVAAARPDAGSPTPPAGDDASASPPPGDMPDATAAPDVGVAPASCSGLAAQPKDSVWTLMVGADMRSARVHVPASYDPTLPTAVVLNFHGYTSNAQQEELLCYMDAKADAAGFVVVYPEGEQGSWNAGACCGYATQNKVDDLGFVNALLDKLLAEVCVDPHRIFATGMSNGGFFSHRLGCELSSRIAAIAPVAGVLGEPSCAPGRPVPVIEFHGTADPLVPYTGSTTLGFPSVPDTFAGWAARDGCTGAPVETYRNQDSHCATYQSCAAGAEVTLCTVDGGGHTWPGGLPIPSFGYTTPNLSATDAMWSFFTHHAMP